MVDLTRSHIDEMDYIEQKKLLFNFSRIPNETWEPV